MSTTKETDETEFKILIQKIKDEIKLKETEETEETEKQKIYLAIDNFFDTIEKTYIVDILFKNSLTNINEDEIKENIRKAVKIGNEIKKKVTNMIISEEDAESKIQQLFLKQKSQMDIDYENNKKKIYICILLFLTKILDKEIQIKYNNDKTSVEQETLDKLNTIIKSKTAVEQETFDKLNTIIKSKIGFKNIIENRDEEEDKEREEEEEEDKERARARNEKKIFVPIPPTTSNSTRYQRNQRNYTKKIKELNPVLPRRYLSSQPLKKKKKVT